jgi:hypothetical protein
MPIDLRCRIMRASHAVVHALKRVVGATKLYVHTMCSGELSYLHLQFIPRRSGELLGGACLPPSVASSCHITHPCRRCVRRCAPCCSERRGGFGEGGYCTPARNPPPNQALRRTRHIAPRR